MKRLMICLVAAALCCGATVHAEDWTDKKTPFYYAGHITTNTTTTVTSATSYISSIVVSVTNIGTTEVLKIQNKEGTPKIIYQQGSPLVLGTAAPIPGVAPPALMTSGIDIVTSGGGAATVDVFITYWQ